MRKLIQQGALFGVLMLSVLPIDGSFAGQATPDGYSGQCNVTCDLVTGRCQIYCEVKCKWIE